MNRQNRITTVNKGLEKVAVHCCADTFVVNQTLIFQIKFCDKNPHFRQAPKPSIHQESQNLRSGFLGV